MTKDHVIAAAFANEARRVQASGTEFWNAAAADHAYREAVAIGEAFEAARERADRRAHEEIEAETKGGG